MKNGKPYILVFGPIDIDEYYTAAEWAPEGGKCLLKPAGTHAGGMMHNAAHVFAALKENVVFLDTVNTGAPVRSVLQGMEKAGIDISQMEYNPALPDPKCMVIQTPGERTILVVDSGKPEMHLTQNQRALFYNAAYVYTNVHAFLRIHNAEDMADELRKRGVKLVFDVEASAFTKEGTAIIHKAAILFFNEGGFEKYRGDRPQQNAFAALFDAGVELVTVTKGANGSITRTPHENNQTAALQVPVVDPTGAGDTFNSAFLHRLIQGDDIHKAARFANAAAGYSVTRQGPLGGAAAPKVIEDFASGYTP